MHQCTRLPAGRILHRYSACIISWRGPSICSASRTVNSTRHQRCKPVHCAVAEADGRAVSDTQAEQYDSRDRRKPRKAATPSVVLQSARAATAGDLPEVLAATFPHTFPTLSAARRGTCQAFTQQTFAFIELQ
jgi:hypothetical protein